MTNTTEPVDVDACPETGALDCRACSGEVCLLCGAGCWSDVTDCEHDTADRHVEAPVRAARLGCRPCRYPRGDHEWHDDSMPPAGSRCEAVQVCGVCHTYRWIPWGRTRTTNRWSYGRRADLPREGDGRAVRGGQIPAPSWVRRS